MQPHRAPFVVLHYCDCTMAAGGIIQMGLLLVCCVLVDVEPAQNSFDQISTLSGWHQD